MKIKKTLTASLGLILLLLAAGQGRAVEFFHCGGDRESWAYRLKIDGQDIPVTAFPNIGPEDYERIAAENAKISKWLAPAAKYVGVHYAHLACDGEIRVELAATEAIRKFTIHPKRREVKAAIDGKTLRFTVENSEPRYFVIEVNDLPPFCLLVDPPEKDAPSRTADNVVDAANYLDDATGKRDQTEGFAKAIAAMKGTKKILYVPAGIYLTDTIKIHDASEFSIYLAPGCMIRTKTSPPGKNLHAQGLSIENSHNINIFGRGYLDHQAYENFRIAGNDFHHRGESDLDPKQRYKKEEPKGVFKPYLAVPALSQAAVLVARSHDIEIEGLAVRNSRCFNYNILACDRIAIRGCKALSPPACTPEWTDAIDVVATDSLSIDGFFGYTSDDCFAWGNIPDYGPLVELADSRPLTNCTVRNLVGWNTRANGIRLGWYGNTSETGVRDLSFENCDFCGIEALGLLINPLKKSAADEKAKRYGTLRLKNCGFDCERLQGRPVGSRNLRIDRLEFDHVNFDVRAKDWVLEGAEPDSIGELILRNVTIDGKKVTDLKQSKINVKNARTVSVE
jgi:hypothetical protein